LGIIFFLGWIVAIALKIDYIMSPHQALAAYYKPALGIFIWQILFYFISK
jgi:hypothetical protein